jgi:omega-6 fatty acid desaturase (delta-12 desaturase)
MSHKNRLPKTVKAFLKPDNFYSAFQLASSIGLLCLCYAAMFWGVTHGHYIALALALPAAGLAVRIFVLQHDLGHRAMFTSRAANIWSGRLCSLFTFTPFDHWRRHHGLHHMGWNNMDERGKLSNMYSDCLTVAEYRALSKTKRFMYRLERHPAVSLLIMPPIIFLLVYRYPFDCPKGWAKEKYGTYATDLAILLIYGGLGHFVGYLNVLLVVGLVIYPASVFGVWLFMLQHTFDSAHWTHDEEWNSFEASLTGCSLLKLPAVLQWFSASIGYHHVHHAAPSMPNYRLVACHEAHEVFRKSRQLGLREGLAEIGKLRLWDEAAGVMVDINSVTLDDRPEPTGTALPQL